jgi:PAT family acetyl-CoA transporter-like MFS transporter 1
LLIRSACSVSNLGGTFPRFFVLKLVDMFTVATCIPPTAGTPLPSNLKGPLVTESFSCAISAARDQCIQGAGICEIQRDGYYIMNIVCVIAGTLTFLLYIKPAAMKLQALPLRAWRISEPTHR